jgi:hypothetical protein
LKRRFSGLSKARRVVALLFSVVLLLGPLELSIPDVHDGDAIPVAVTGDGAGQDVQSGFATDPSFAPESGPTHSHHVDHCAHAHGDGVPAAVAFWLSGSDVFATPHSPDPAISDGEIVPHDPPPIA